MARLGLKPDVRLDRKDVRMIQGFWTISKPEYGFKIGASLKVELKIMTWDFVGIHYKIRESIKYEQEIEIIGIHKQ